jgi:hypothetical protein
MVLFMAVLCLAALSLAGISAAADASASQNITLNSYEGNLTEKKVTQVDMLSLFGSPGYFFAEAVKFKAPKPNWKINALQLYGWDGYNGTAETIPYERVIAFDIRDKDLNLLYKYSDSQLPYTNYARNATGVLPMTFELPSIPVSDEFYVCFYDRGAVTVVAERLNSSSQNSFLYLEPANRMLEAKISISANETIPVNWLMTVKGT